MAMKLIGVCPDGAVWELDSGQRLVLGLPRGEGPTPILPAHADDRAVLERCRLRYVMWYDGFEWVRGA